MEHHTNITKNNNFPHHILNKLNHQIQHEKGKHDQKKGEMTVKKKGNLHLLHAKNKEIH
jgi:hypothetical protein